MLAILSPKTMQKNTHSKQVGQSKDPKAGGQKTSKPRLRVSADRFFTSKAAEAFSRFQDKPPLEAISELGFCFVKTTLGYLQVDIGWLLILVGGILQVEKHQRKQPMAQIELTDDVLDATVEVLRAVNRYTQVDLLGMYFEAGFLVKAKTLEETRLPFGKPYTVEKLLTLMLSKKEKHEMGSLEFFADLLGAWPGALLLPEVLEMFIQTTAEQGPEQTKRWREFIQRHFGTQRKRGRRSEELYDLLFKKRVENPSLSYGKLALEVAKAKKIDFAIAREQLKAAIAYRRKRAARSKK
ncbi:MAG: hypothetical protein DMG35_10835 [Acidobacteria bacterium]|nr:MAG: hypothetical protein DMG35_10835 [Acidobacteriota bacterium]